MSRRFNSFLRKQLEAYLQFRQKLGFTSFANPCTARDFDHYLIFRDVAKVEQIDEALIANWVHAIPKHSPGTKNHKLVFARGFLSYLVRLELARDNPALRIALLKEKPFKPYIYSLKEIHEILEATGRYKRLYPKRLFGWTLETMLFLIYACGLRLGEAVNLKVCDVNFEENTISLWRTKFHKERLVPFSAAVAEKLKAYLARRQEMDSPAGKDSPFFCHYGKKYSGKTIAWHFRTLREPYGRTGPRIHDFRHTFAVHRLYKWYQEGHDVLNKLPLLSTYMGHVSIVSTQVYLTIGRDLLREGNRRFEAGFGEVAERALKRAFKKL